MVELEISTSRKKLYGGAKNFYRGGKKLSRVGKKLSGVRKKLCTYKNNNKKKIR